MSTEEEKIHGPWRQIGEEWQVIHRVPTIVNGFGAPVETAPLAIHCYRERRAVWEFVGYEERTVES